MELFKQTAFNPIPVEIQTALIWSVQNGYFDSIDVKEVVRATTSLREFFETRGASTMDQIRSGKQLTEAIEADLAELLKEWQTLFNA